MPMQDGFAGLALAPDHSSLPASALSAVNAFPSPDPVGWLFLPSEMPGGHNFVSALQPRTICPPCLAILVSVARTGCPLATTYSSRRGIPCTRVCFACPPRSCAMNTRAGDGRRIRTSSGRPCTASS